MHDDPNSILLNMHDDPNSILLNMHVSPMEEIKKDTTNIQF
jgi:hypothetical protein